MSDSSFFVYALRRRTKTSRFSEALLARSRVDWRQGAHQTLVHFTWVKPWTEAHKRYELARFVHEVDDYDLADPATSSVTTKRDVRILRAREAMLEEEATARRAAAAAASS